MRSSDIITSRPCSTGQAPVYPAQVYPQGGTVPEYDPFCMAVLLDLLHLGHVHPGADIPAQQPPGQTAYHNADVRIGRRRNDQLYGSDGSLEQPALPLSGKDYDELGQLRINFNDYQALLPVPYYNVGSEDYDHTINDFDGFSAFSYRLSLYSHLPMMACKLSRIPPRFSEELLNLVTTDSLSLGMKRLMNDKPILVAVDRQLIKDTALWSIPDKASHQEAYKAYWAANKLAARNGLQPIDSLGSIYFLCLEAQVSLKGYFSLSAT